MEVDTTKLDAYTQVETHAMAFEIYAAFYNVNLPRIAANNCTEQ